MTTQSSTVFALNEEISRIDVEKWGRCFPQSFNGNIPEKNVLNLKYTLRTLQKRLTGMYEKDLYNNICSSAVLNQDLHSLLLEKGVCENKVSDSSLFVTIVPRRFGLCATNEALLFCLAIHKTLNIIKQKYPSIKIVAYMDDISLIGSFDLLELVAQEIADSYENIGLHLNASKCLLIGSSAQDLVINDSIVPFTNYSSDAFKFLGCWLGNVPQIQNELQVIMEKMKIELDSISSLDIEKHIKFFMLKICYTGKITHILRSCAPSIALDFCRSFNSLRTEFFADLLDVEPEMLKSHLFSSVNLGVPNCSPYLYELSCELEKLPPQIWTKCFPQSIQEIPNRSLFNLQFCCKKLQQKLSKIFESLDFDVRLGLAKKKNPAFANLLQDMCDSTSSALVTTIPQVYGTLLSDSAWTLNMRFRSFIWPDNLPHNLICKCSREITTTHLLNCKHFITFRSKVHDAVRDQLYCMCKSHRIESFLEPLLSNLFDAENDFHKNNRGDVILPGLDGSFILLDVMSVDPCNASNERLVNSEIHNPLSNAENFKFKNTMNLCPNWPVYSMQNTICIHLYFPFWFTCTNCFTFFG
ncbi:hypothetical protein P9112_009450 [Eukaryota sp. TZLM1-RC]